MNVDVEVVWQRGDSEMPANIEHIVKKARNELLLRSLQLPNDAVNIIRYNASKSNKTINEYIASLVLENIQTAQ
ncbi:MAG: hypothetical protein FWB71_01285 [Defluviitaleaceae bacterium]|nr:hypothetical protein [Defluviitaleaceae bacterium]